MEKDEFRQFNKEVMSRNNSRNENLVLLKEIFEMGKQRAYNINDYIGVQEFLINKKLEEERDSKYKKIKFDLSKIGNKEIKCLISTHDQKTMKISFTKADNIYTCLFADEGLSSDEFSRRFGSYIGKAYEEGFNNRDFFRDANRIEIIGKDMTFNCLTDSKENNIYLGDQLIWSKKHNENKVSVNVNNLQDNFFDDAYVPIRDCPRWMQDELTEKRFHEAKSLQEEEQKTMKKTIFGGLFGRNKK